jgi:hypothetical protein
MKAIVLALSVALSAAVPDAQVLSDQEITTAIEQGRAGKTLHKTCKASGENGFDIVVEGPVGRIMRAAHLAKGQGRQFTPADVTPFIGGPTLTVAALHDATLSTAANAVQSKEIPGMYVPSDMSMAAVDWRRAQGAMGYTDGFGMMIRSKPKESQEAVVLGPVGRVAGRSWIWIWRKSGPDAGDMAAAFDLAAFRALPSGDVEVVVFRTAAGERRCKISEKERKAIR